MIKTERAGNYLNRDPGGSMRDTRLIGLLTERLSSIASTTTTFSNSLSNSSSSLGYIRKECEREH
jgi:hypothetical protein